ncbi:putative serine/threonine-protein kinase pats1, partial [Exaiptasia diaphana]
TSKGIPALRQDIGERALRLEHVGDILPNAWVKVRLALEELERPYISARNYYSRCELFGLDREQASFLSQYYHDLGVFLHFQDNVVLSQIVFLQPDWATNAVYRIVDTKEVQRRYGRFSFSQLSTIWSDYPEDRYPQLLELMKKFELCFELPSGSDYVVPELLSAERPRVLEGEGMPLRLHYQYDFMPSGVITRFIVRSHDLIEGNLYWKSGAVLSRSGCRALVVAEPLARRIRVVIWGEDKRHLLAVIRREFDYIHMTLNEPNVSEQIPCLCAECVESTRPYMHNFDYLKRARKKRKWTVECKKSLEDVSIYDILGEFAAPSRESTTDRGKVILAENYIEAGSVPSTIVIGGVRIQREYSPDLLAAADLSATDFRTFIDRISQLNPSEIKVLEKQVEALKAEGFEISKAEK